MTYKIVTDRELALERENANMLDTINKQSISIEKLRKVVEMKDLTIEALKADAERYQFMRDKCAWTMTSEPLRTTKLSVTINAPLYAESDWDDMDYVFNEAMKESK